MQAVVLLVSSFTGVDLVAKMRDAATQLVLKRARMGPGHRIPLTNGFTRLTLDTIALCAMDYRFNSFYQKETYPFVEAMSRTLTAGNGRSSLWDVVWALGGGKSKSLEEDQLLI